MAQLNSAHSRAFLLYIVMTLGRRWGESACGWLLSPLKEWAAFCTGVRGWTEFVKTIQWPRIKMKLETISTTRNNGAIISSWSRCTKKKAMQAVPSPQGWGGVTGGEATSTREGIPNLPNLRASGGLNVTSYISMLRVKQFCGAHWEGSGVSTCCHPQSNHISKQSDLSYHVVWACIYFSKPLFYQRRNRRPWETESTRGPLS